MHWVHHFSWSWYQSTPNGLVHTLCIIEAPMVPPQNHKWAKNAKNHQFYPIFCTLLFISMHRVYHLGWFWYQSTPRCPAHKVYITQLTVVPPRNHKWAKTAKNRQFYPIFCTFSIVTMHWVNRLVWSWYQSMPRGPAHNVCVTHLSVVPPRFRKWAKSAQNRRFYPFLHFFLS